MNDNRLIYIIYISRQDVNCTTNPISNLHLVHSLLLTPDKSLNLCWKSWNILSVTGICLLDVDIFVYCWKTWPDCSTKERSGGLPKYLLQGKNKTSNNVIFQNAISLKQVLFLTWRYAFMNPSQDMQMGEMRGRDTFHTSGKTAGKKAGD